MERNFESFLVTSANQIAVFSTSYIPFIGIRFIINFTLNEGSDSEITESAALDFYDSIQPIRMAVAPRRICNVRKCYACFNFSTTCFCVNCNYIGFAWMEMSISGVTLFLN